MEMTLAAPRVDYLNVRHTVVPQLKTAVASAGASSGGCPSTGFAAAMRLKKFGKTAVITVV